MRSLGPGLKVYRTWNCLQNLRLWWANMGPWWVQNCHQRVKTSVNEQIHTRDIQTYSNRGVKNELKNIEDIYFPSHFPSVWAHRSPGFWMRSAPCQTSSYSPPMNQKLMSYWIPFCLDQVTSCKYLLISCSLWRAFTFTVQKYFSFVYIGIIPDLSRGGPDAPPHPTPHRLSRYAVCSGRSPAPSAARHRASGSTSSCPIILSALLSRSAPD